MTDRVELPTCPKFSTAMSTKPKFRCSQCKQYEPPDEYGTRQRGGSYGPKGDRLTLSCSSVNSANAIENEGGIFGPNGHTKCQSYWPPIFSGQDTGWRGPSKPPNDHDRRRIQQRVLVMQWMRHTVAIHSRRSVDAACSAFAPWTIFVIGLSFLNVRDSEWL